MVNMLGNMLKNASDKDIESALNNIKTLVSPQDYEKIKTMLDKKRFV